MSVNWNPWHGCQKISEGCRHCYVYRMDSNYEKDSSLVQQTGNFNLPIKRKRDRSFKIPSHEMVYTCFTSDFFVAGADAWRKEAWRMMRIRKDLQFFIITKRIDRFTVMLPEDWGEGYDNVMIGCTVENQKMADYRLPIFLNMPIRHKSIICAPLLEPLNLDSYLLPCIEEVSVGGESGLEARICDYDWILSIRAQCIKHQIPFNFHQTGARLRKDGTIYRIPRAFQHSQAAKAHINWNLTR